MFAYNGPNAAQLQQKLSDFQVAASILPRPPNLLTMTSSHTEDIASLQQRIWQLSQQVSRTPGLTTQNIITMNTELREVSVQFNEITKKLTEERQQALTERDNLICALEQKQRLVQNALAERDRACTERDQAIQDRDLLRSQLENLHHRQRRTDESISEIERTHDATVKDLREKIQFREEQLAAKRSLWMDNHPSSVVRHAGDQSSRDVFGTPTPNSAALRAGLSPPYSVRPTNLAARFEMMAVAQPRQPQSPRQMWSSSDNGSGSRVFSSVNPSEEETRAMVPFQSLGQIAADFREKFNGIFELVENWAFSYTNQVPDLAYDQKLSHEQQYWSSLIKCAFLQKASVQEAHNHTILLLRDAQTRPWFIMRVFNQYLVEEVLAAKNWLKFSEGYDMELNRIDARLRERGLSVQERSELVTKRSNSISAILEDKKMFPAYRTFFLAAHTAKLRAKLGPLLDLHAPRADAGRSIGAIVVEAYDLSAKMYISYKTFVIAFPECGARFLDSSMVCRDAQIPENTLALQIKQMRVMLAMSPVVTIRDDRVRSIEVKDVQEAHVLTMK